MRSFFSLAQFILCTADHHFMPELHKLDTSALHSDGVAFLLQGPHY
jgi:hypothetical protein